MPAGDRPGVESARVVARVTGADAPRGLPGLADAHPDDREVYAALKRDLAAQGFTDAMQYNNAKAGLIYDLYERIFAADPEHSHTPRPR